MSFKKRRRSGKNSGIGILLILLVIAVLFYFVEESNNKSSMETVPQVRMEFSGGESISFYQPVEYTEEVSMEMADTALAKYFADQQTTVQANTDSQRSEDLENRMINENEVDTSVSAPLNENVIGGDIGNTYYTRDGDPLEGHDDYSLVDGVPTFTRGHIINIVGKIEKSDPAPYFFNIVIRMGNDNPIRSGSYIETNYDGTFLYNFPSDLTWRTGTYTATISTIGDDSSVLTFDWVFDIIE
jgi:hypothetical protein